MGRLFIFCSFCSQAAISLANNKGDLGGVFKDLMSERAMRSLATSDLAASIIAVWMPLSSSRRLPAPLTRRRQSRTMSPMS
ncbi:DUF637 domain-containing protein [Desulfovibrio subterraneus]|uniref:DUF637 domain-containing protein n=1 Tax=Desulfovibrio subterraneus TaxID=2718620 RepID=UPI00157AE09D